MIENHTSQKLIYAGLRETFTGPAASFRQKKPVREAIAGDYQKPRVQNLIKEGYDIHGLTEVAIVLLKEDVFQSISKAKARFPELFEAPASSTATQKMSEPEGTASSEAATTGPKTLESDITTSAAVVTEIKAPKSTDEKNETETDNADRQTAETKLPTQSSEQPPEPSVSSNPVFLPFWYQHRIMVRVQTILERACFNFAIKRLHSFMQSKAYDCAEATELNEWASILLKYQKELTQSHSEDMKTSLPKVLTSIRQIRHTAVHRMRLQARSALDLITDGETLAKLLQDETCLEQLSTVRQQLLVSIEDLEQNKNALESRLAEIKETFAEKRAQLVREEIALIQNAEKDCKENDFFSNANPDDTLDALMAAQTRWKQARSASLSTDDNSEYPQTPELDFGTETTHDSIVSVSHATPKHVLEPMYGTVTGIPFPHLLGENISSTREDLARYIDMLL